MNSSLAEIRPGDDASVSLEIQLSGGDIAAAIRDLGRFVAASEHVQGALVKSNATIGDSAFAGGDKGGYFETMSTVLASWDTPEEVSEATLLTVSEERLAEIADVYTPPEYLLNPANEVDAAIAYIIKGLSGYSEDTSESIEDQAMRSAESVVTTPGLTISQMKALGMGGVLNNRLATQNALYRSLQLETLDHALRLLIIRDMRRPYGDGSVYMSTDYTWASGPLGDAISVVNGYNGFSEDNSGTDKSLTMGMLGQKITIRIKDGQVNIGSQNMSGSMPIWPQEAVDTYNQYQARLAEERVASAAERRRVADEMQTARLAEQTAELLEWRSRVEASMQEAEDNGRKWIGIFNITGPLGEEGKLEEFVKKNYDCKEVTIIPNAAIYGGKAPSPSNTEVTVYIK